MKLSKALFLILFTLSVAACGNTLRGVGQDVEKAGKTIQDCC